MIFRVYRRDDDWPQFIKATLVCFSKQFGVPDLLRVSATELDTVTQALEGLGVPVPVKANGGTLLGELELGRHDEV